MNPEIEWERVSLNKDRSFLYHWALIHAIVLAENKAGKRVERIYQGEGGGRRVALLVNGVQVPLVETFADADKQVERMIEEKAHELLARRVGAKLWELDDTIDRAKSVVMESFGLEEEE